MKGKNSTNREFGTFNLQKSSVSVHNVHFMVCALLSISGKKEAHKLLTRKLFVETAVNPGIISRLAIRNAYFSWFGGEHLSFFVRGQPDPHQSKKFFVYVPFSLGNMPNAVSESTVSNHRIQ